MRTPLRLLLTVLVLVCCASAARAQFTPPVLRYTWGGFGTTPGAFDEPYDIAISPAGEVYVTDTRNNRIQVFDRSGAFRRQWGSMGPGNGQFVFPTGIAFGPDGNVYVTDTNRWRVQVFSPDGTFLRKWGTVGTGASQFRSPWGIDVDTDGLVYVSDIQNSRVTVFTPDGTYVRTIHMVSTGCNNLALDHYGHLWTADNQNNVIVEYTTAGAQVGVFGGQRMGSLYVPTGIAIDPSGRVHVFDSGNHRVQVLSDTGAFLALWGDETVFPLYYRGMEFDADGNLYLATPELNLVQVFTPDAPVSAHPTTWGALKAAYR